MKRLLMLILFFSACSCSKKESPASVIENERFESVYIELLDSAQVIQSAAVDSLLSPVAERILKRHEVSVAQFKATVQFYNADTGKWKEFYENVMKRIDERGTKNTTQ